MSIYIDKHKILTSDDKILCSNLLPNAYRNIEAKGENRVGQVVLDESPFLASQGSTVTISFTIDSDKSSGRIYLGITPGWSVVDFFDVVQGTQIHSKTIEVPTNSPNLKITIDHYSGNLTLSHMMINTGNEVAEWHPALEDFAMQNDIVTIKSEIQQLKKQIGGVAKHLRNRILSHFTTSEMEVA